MSNTETKVEYPDSQGYHYDRIQCPECGHKQAAKVYHTWPFYTYVHDCTRCNYTIMESEWNSIITV